MNYDNINELNELMHAFLYDKSTQNEYIYEKTNIENITLSDIVKNDNFDYQLILNSVLENKPNFDIIDAIDSKVILKKYCKNYPLTIVIQKHNNEIQHTKNIIDIYYGLFIIQIVMEYRLLNNVPFYLLNICNFNIYNDDLNNDYSSVINSFFEKDTKSRYCFSLFEHYNSYITIDSFLSTEQSDETLKLLFFQLFASYAFLSYKLNNFRHNNFTIHSFLIEQYTAPEKYYLSIGDNLMKFETSFVVKLFDFRKSQIANYSNNINCINDNPSYDIYNLLCSLYNCNNVNHSKIVKIIEKFIDIEHIIKKYNNEEIFIKQFITLNPINLLLKNNFFDIFMDNKYITPDNLLSLSLNETEIDTKKNKTKLLTIHSQVAVMMKMMKNYILMMRMMKNLMMMKILIMMKILMMMKILIMKNLKKLKKIIKKINQTKKK